jgi:hypothetical protein
MKYRMMITSAATAVLLAPLAACGGTSADCQAVEDAFASAEDGAATGDMTAYGRALQDSAPDIPDAELRDAVNTIGEFWVSMGDWEIDDPFDGPDEAEVEAAFALVFERCADGDVPEAPPVPELPSF